MHKRIQVPRLPPLNPYLLNYAQAAVEWCQFETTEVPYVLRRSPPRSRWSAAIQE
jgi:hypothetical protein